MNTETSKNLEAMEAELKYWEKQFNFCHRMCKRAWAHNAFESHKKLVDCLIKMGQITSGLRLKVCAAHGFTLQVEGQVK
jgi:hypothetical protein